MILCFIFKVMLLYSNTDDLFFIIRVVIYIPSDVRLSYSWIKNTVKIEI